MKKKKKRKRRKEMPELQLQHSESIVPPMPLDMISFDGQKIIGNEVKKGKDCLEILDCLCIACICFDCLANCCRKEKRCQGAS